MNTPRSVAYGWAALIVATGIGYYMAKGVNEERWKEQRARGLRHNEEADWRQKIAKAEAEIAAAKAAAAEGKNSTERGA